MSTIEIENEYMLDLYPRRELVIVRGEGAVLHDDQGNEYIDCASNVGVSNIGHGNEKVAEAIRSQYLTLGSCYGMFYNDVRARLVSKLVEITPEGLDKVYLCNSGSEAIESAIKFARAFTGRTGIISAMRGFHGKTMGSHAATWDRRHKGCFGPAPAGFTHVPFNNIERMSDAMDDDTTGVILEIIQGEGGIHPGSIEYFREVRRLCDENGAILIIDEVQTGFGRTGRMFACQGVVTPDILCLAKSIAGGVPMGAVLSNSRIEVPKGSHSSTFGGSPLACSASLATIDVIEGSNLATASGERGDQLMTALQDIDSPLIREVRGRGLMVGIELTENAMPYALQLIDTGVITLLAGKKVIRLLPPLVITEEQVTKVANSIREVLC